jgi:hypothetical protein
MDAFTSWRKGWYHTAFFAAAAHCKPQRKGTFRVLGMKGRGERENWGKPRFVMNPSAARILHNPRLLLGLPFRSFIRPKRQTFAAWKRVFVKLKDAQILWTYSVTRFVQIAREIKKREKFSILL